MKNQQSGFSDWERSPVRRQTRKEKFLCEMEAVLPFSPLVKVMQLKPRFIQVQKELDAGVREAHPFEGHGAINGGDLFIVSGQKA